MRENILKAGIVGRLVANDFSGAMVSAQLVDADPETGAPVDYIAVSKELEEKVRARIERDKVDIAVQAPVSVHMIGFAKVVGDVADGALSVVTFAVVTVALTLLLVWIYIQSFRIALVPVVSSLVAMVWMLGLLVLLGYGVDPLGILVPFIIFAIGTSHGVQKISAVSDAAMSGADSNEAARRTFRLLFLPAIVALLANLVGFITILLIPVQVIREMAVTASLGIGVIILTDLVLLPVLVSFVPITGRFRDRVARRQQALQGVWERLARITHRGPAAVIIAIALVLGVLGRDQGPRDADRRHPGRRAGAARRLALQPGQQPDQQPVLDRHRHHQRDRRDEGRRLHQLPDHRRDRPLRLAHGERRGRARRHVARGRVEGGQRRLERGQPQVAQPAARRAPAGAGAELHRDQHRAAQPRLQRDAGDAVPVGPPRRDDRARGRGGQGVPRGATRRPK